MTETTQRATRPPKAGTREAPFKLRDNGAGSDGLTLDGYASVFNSETVIDSFEGRFREVVAPKSMSRSFRDRPPIVQYDHGQHSLIGSLPVAQLISAAEETDPVLAPAGGAHIVARMFDDWLFSPLRAAIAAQAISGMSFRFQVLRETWELADGTPLKDDMAVIRALERGWDPNVPDEELPLRTLRELIVPELGPARWPAYTASSIQIRDGRIDLNRLDEPEQRQLLARAIYTLDGDVQKSVARGGPGLDESARLIRAMLQDVQARRRRVTEQEQRFGLV